MQCYQTKWVFNDSFPKGIEVPCGKCLVCLSNKRADWAFRLEQEYKHCDSAAFITLTYSSKFVPSSGVNKRHFQLFMKRLRKKSGKRLRYYAVGEYGSKTGRPHYHAIIFNYEGSEIFLQSCWASYRKEPYGIVHIGKVTQASILYATKYIVQRDAFPPDLAKPFSLMSRAFGLGAWYLTDAMVSWHRSDSRTYTNVYGRLGRLPRYYKDKIWPPSDWSNCRSVREKISRLSKQTIVEAEKKERDYLLSRGYDPDKILLELRSAAMSRIKEKTVFTQTF